MGRQIAVVLTDKDEEEFLAFLRSMSSIRLFEALAPTVNDLTVDRFLPREEAHWVYYIWNMALAWEPEFGTVTSGERQGWRFLQQPFGSPIVEYVRARVSGEATRPGRFYWARSISKFEDLGPYVRTMRAWWDKIVSWVRKHGYKELRGSVNAYYLPYPHRPIGNPS